VTHEPGQRPFFNGEGAFSKPKKARKRGRKFNGFISSVEFLEKMQPPDYLVAGVLLRGSTYTFTGNTGHCKTLIALLMAIKVARGEWFCGRKCQQGTVVIFAGENPDNVRYQFYGMCSELGIDPYDLPIVWHEGVFDISEATDRIQYLLGEYPDLALVVFDSLQAFFLGDDDSLNTAMLDFAADFRSLLEFHPARPVGIIVAHPVKRAKRDDLLPRGGSAITNELDGNLTSWVEGNVATFHWLGKLRGIPFDPIKLESAIIKPEYLLDSEGNQMAATVVRPMVESREAELKTEQNRVELAILAAVHAEANLSEREIAVKAQTSRSTARRTVDRLREKKWMRDYSGKLVLTKEGEKALELGTSEVAGSPA
jgi:hypothetical protein